MCAGSRSVSERNDRKRFLAWVQNNIPDLSKTDAERLSVYGDLLYRASGRVALISSGDRNRLYSRHLAECLHPGWHESFADGEEILDVGSGGGLPGIPLAIVRPDLQVLLVEPRGKKAAFLERALLTLGLGNARVWLGSLEELVRSSPGKHWGGATSRAFRWRPGHVAALGEALRPDGHLVRTAGAPADADEVRWIPIDDARGLQVWQAKTVHKLDE